MSLSNVCFQYTSSFRTTQLLANKNVVGDEFMPDFPINPISMDGYLQTLSPSAIRDLMSEAESESKFTQFLPGDFIPVIPAGSSGESSGASGVPSKDVDPDVSGSVSAQGGAVAPKPGSQPSDVGAAFSFEDRYIPGEEVPLNTWTPYSPAQNLAAQRSSMGTAAAVLQAYASAQGVPPQQTAAAAPVPDGQESLAAESLSAAVLNGEELPLAPLPQQTARPTAQTAQTQTQLAGDTAPAAGVRVAVDGKETVLQAIPTDEATFAAPLQEMLSPMADLKNTVVRQVTRGDSYPILEFDAPHAQQILSRIFTTSLGFSSGGGQINLIVDTQAMEDAAVRLRFVVQAQQLELPPAVLAYLNENGPLPLGPPLENLALNLALSRHLAALLNGNLAVRSDEEGNTLFYLDLPARQGSSHAKAVSGEIGRFSGRRILVAMEDSPAFREVADLLHKREMFPDAAADSDSAVARFADSRTGYYDAVVTSLDGETVRRIRTLSRPDAARIPILSLLPAPSGAALSAAFESGCSACLPLPITPAEFFDTLGLLLL
jgi:CheY-like chemotaxis protein